MKAGDEAKIWIEPEVRVAYSTDFDPKTLRRLAEIASAHAAEIREAWHDHFR